MDFRGVVIEVSAECSEQMEAGDGEKSTFSETLGGPREIRFKRASWRSSWVAVVFISDSSICLNIAELIIYYFEIRMKK